MSVPEFSIIIPTHNRLDVLPRVLDAVEAQRDAPAAELIVVDDGSADGTREWLGRRTFRLPARVVSQPCRGPAAARNRGIELAAGRILAFLGDDMIPDLGWLAAHHRAHREPGPRAYIGYTDWHPRMRRTRFLRFLNEQGRQFGFSLIEDPADARFNFFYASNLSLPRALLGNERFDERFPDAAWEDIELGYRLARYRGMRLAYLPAARTAHDHPTSLARFMGRQERAGYAAVLFAQLHPELAPFLGLAGGPPPLRSRLRQRLVEAAGRALERLPVEAGRLWESGLQQRYVRGLHRGWREREALVMTARTAPVAAAAQAPEPPPPALAADGAAGPLISVIVRTKDRPELLPQALASVARSAYRRLEVIVVNDGGATPALPAAYPVPLRLANLPANVGRGGAANAGAAQARGDHLAFVDDDDVVEPEHFGVLADLVTASGAAVVYTDAAAGIYERDPGGPWRRVERRVPYSRDFDPELLLFDNYIPLNTVLIERRLFDAVGGFDPSFAILGDWDLLIRLSERAAFHHQARVTCEYRHFRGSDHQALGERARERPAFLPTKARVIDKHRARITPELTARVIDRLRLETVDALEASASERHRAEALEQELRAMRATRAWRLAEWWRRLRPGATDRDEQQGRPSPRALSPPP